MDFCPVVLLICLVRLPCIANSVPAIDIQIQVSRSRCKPSRPHRIVLAIAAGTRCQGNAFTGFKRWNTPGKAKTR